MGKITPPKPPDYTPVAQANREVAEMQLAFAREQQEWAKQVYAQDRDLALRVIDTTLPIMTAEAQAGREARARYASVFQPVEDRFVSQALDYASPARQEYEASRAVADVVAATNAQREAALAQLASYGVDPSLARAGALDSALRTYNAAAAAGAANEARRQTDILGRSMLGEAVNVGRGYPQQIAQAYATSQQAGQSSVGTKMQTSALGGQLMGTGLQWGQAGASTLGNWGNQVAGMNNAYYNAIGDYNRAVGSTIGGVLGGALGLAAAPMSGFKESVLGSMIFRRGG